MEIREAMKLVEDILRPLAYVSYGILAYSTAYCIKIKVDEWRNKHAKQK